MLFAHQSSIIWPWLPKAKCFHHLSSMRMRCRGFVAWSDRQPKDFEDLVHIGRIRNNFLGRKQLEIERATENSWFSSSHHTEHHRNLRSKETWYRKCWEVKKGNGPTMSHQDPSGEKKLNQRIYHDTLSLLENSTRSLGSSEPTRTHGHSQTMPNNESSQHIWITVTGENGRKLELTREGSRRCFSTYSFLIQFWGIHGIHGDKNPTWTGWKGWSGLMRC